MHGTKRANWTDDFEAEFRHRCGYELRPWLPFVTDFNNPPPITRAMKEAVGRVRHDYSRVLVELFRERFIQSYHQWCRAHGALSRYQAYGSPWHLGLLEGFMETDIPETNNWLFSWGYRRHGFRVWIKYATSAAHIAGKRIVSIESMTNSHGVFEASLEMIKAADDLNFIMGVNHSVLHGFNYSPPERTLRKSGGARVIDVPAPKDEADFLRWTADLLVRLDASRRGSAKSPTSQRCGGGRVKGCV